MRIRHYDGFSLSGACRLSSSLVLILSLISGFAAAQNWVQVTEIPSGSVYAMAEAKDQLFAATDSVIYISTNGGSSWAQTSSQPPSTRIYVLHSSQGYLYVGTSGDGVFRTLDGGQTWQSMNSGLSGNALNVTGFATRGDSLYAATNGSGVYLLSLIDPASWQPFNNGLFQFGANSIMTSDHTLVACIGSYVFVHQQGALPWRDATADALQGRLPLVVYRHADFLFLGTTGGIYKSDLSATVWQRADIRALPEQDISAFAAHGIHLFAGLNYRSEHWIWSSEDNGATWEIRAHEFAYLYGLFPAHGRMWACRTDGLWSIDLSGWTSVAAENGHVPGAPYLFQNYPNPFNPTTTLSFYLPVRTAVALKVFDAMGREVSVLIDEERTVGAYSCQWNAEGMASGVYFAQLQAGSFVETRKLVLFR